MPEIAQLTYAEAVNRALAVILESEPRALLFGEDVALPGGVFGVTKGLHRRFGDRVFDTPISESAILGAAVGSAMLGMRPIAEIMWADFVLVALDQLVNQAANVRYVSRGELSAPITVRMQQGSGPGACAQHSQNLEALFAHIPGLQVVMPFSPQDAYECLLAAFYSDDPVVVIENRNLYHRAKETVLLDPVSTSVGGGVIRRTGSDVTVVTWGSIQERVIEAADSMREAERISAEVIDLRWLRPYDVDLIAASVARTGRLLVVHEAHTTGGFGAEIVSAVLERGVTLRESPRRIGTPASRIPAAPSLLAGLLPTVEVIGEAILQLARGVDAISR